MPQILNRWTRAVMYTSDAATLGDAARAAHSSGAVLRDAVLSGADLPIIADIHRKVLAAAGAPGALDMGAWHTCETTHCRAGWVVTLAGDAGRKLEMELGTPAAAALIYQASDPALAMIPDFYASNADALADMKRLAEEELA